MRGREIVFRGKRVEDDKWVYGLLLNGRLIIEAITNDGRAKLAEVRPETVGQFLGYDAKGERLYEGDVVALWNNILDDSLYDMKYGSKLRKNVFMVVKHFKDIPFSKTDKIAYCVFEGFGFTDLKGHLIEGTYLVSENNLKKLKKGKVKLYDVVEISDARTWRGEIMVVGNLWDGRFEINFDEGVNDEEEKD